MPAGGGLPRPLKSDGKTEARREARRRAQKKFRGIKKQELADRAAELEKQKQTILELHKTIATLKSQLSVSTSRPFPTEETSIFTDRDQTEPLTGSNAAGSSEQMTPEQLWDRLKELGYRSPAQVLHALGEANTASDEIYGQTSRQGPFASNLWSSAPDESHLGVFDPETGNNVLWGSEDDGSGRNQSYQEYTPDWMGD